MRIAICLSGHMRRYDKAFPNFKENILSPLFNEQVDIFIHTWDNAVESSSHGWQCGGYEDLANLKVDINKVAALYQPRLIESESYQDRAKTFLLSNFTDKQSTDVRYVTNGALHPASAQYKRFKCNELKIRFEKEQNFRYDIVMQYRPDIVTKNKISFAHFKKGCVFLHMIEPHWTTVNDVYSYGDSETMDKFTNAFHNLREVCEAFAERDNFMSERILYYYLAKFNIPCAAVPLLDYEILRK